MATNGSAKYARRFLLFRFVRRWSSVFAMLGVAIWTLITASAATYQYFSNRSLEARRPFLQKQLDLFFKTAGVAGKLANTEDIDWAETYREFSALRWSDMEMVGNPAIRQSMRRIDYAAFSVAKATPEVHEARRNYLRWTIECLADDMRLALEASWGDIPKPDATATLEPWKQFPSGCNQGGEEPPSVLVARPLPK